MQAIAGLALVAPKFVASMVQDAARYEKQLSYMNYALSGQYREAFSDILLQNLATELSKYLPYSYYDTLEMLYAGLSRRTYPQLDAIGLNCARIRLDFDDFRRRGVSESTAWYYAVINEAARTIDQYSAKPYTIKTQVTDLGNGYGRVDRIITGNDFVMPSNYKQYATNAVLRPSRLIVAVHASDELLHDNIVLTKKALSRINTPVLLP